MRTIKVPTREEYDNYDGAHCRTLYRQLGTAWSCPSCQRTRYQCMRWTTLFPNKPHLRREGWALGLHRHHDHGAPPRFDVTPICEQCNAADGYAKRALHLPVNWSFSPHEIGRFVTPTPHGWHAINLNIAETIFNEHYR